MQMNRSLRLPARFTGGTFTLAAAIVVSLVVAYALVGPQQFSNFLTIGAIYALIALGYTMVYGIIELINFAHGDVFGMGAFVALWLLTVAGFNGAINNPVELAFVLLALFLVTMGVLGTIGVVIERLAYRPLRNAPRLAPLITAIGVSFILENVMQAFFGPSPVSSPQIFTLNARFSIAGASIGYLNVFIVAVAIALMIALQAFVSRTRLGRAMRSTAQDREAAQLMGVNIDQTIAITFFIGSALAGAGGIVWALYFGYAVFNQGFYTGLFAFTAAVLGGIGNTTGAALGGFFIGFVFVAAAQFGYSRWSEVFIFGVLVLVLVFRPAGLLGQQLGERA
jgi:branched-chain amino acid transport system permease protein